MSLGVGSGSTGSIGPGHRSSAAPGGLAGPSGGGLRSLVGLRLAEVAALGGILALAAIVRSWDLGRLSFWYDEVVTVRLARAENLEEFGRLLFTIDATRAPLHPLLLRVWIGSLGASEVAVRSLGVVCGTATVALTYWVGRLAFDRASGIWGAWLAVWSPLLVYYSREARMYALLVLLSTLAWALLFRRGGLRSRVAGADGETTPGGAAVSLPPWKRSAADLSYALVLAALVYTHPLGLLMVATLAGVSLGFVRVYFGGAAGWLGVHLFAALLTFPWIPSYFDHPPEFLTGRLPLRFLAGTPIGFVGGNSLLLVGLTAVVVFGLARRRERLARSEGLGAAVGLLLWLVLPPSVLYLFSWVSTPIFGPARYTLYTAPAFLVLLGQGLAELPAAVRYTLSAGLLAVAAATLGPTVYAPDLKADWRGFAGDLNRWSQREPNAAVLVLVDSHDPSRNVEVETARYYLSSRFRVLPAGSAAHSRCFGGEVLLAIGGKDPAAAVSRAREVGTDRWELAAVYPGLSVFRRLPLVPPEG
jgi:uncharacterized membrane protein